MNMSHCDLLMISEYPLSKEFHILLLVYNAFVYLWQDLLLVKVSQGKGTRLVIPSNATISNRTCN